MGKAMIVKGRLSDPRHIELDEPVTGMQGPVEIVLRQAPLKASGSNGRQDVFKLIASLPPGRRPKDDIDRQIREEREAWGAA